MMNSMDNSDQFSVPAKPHLGLKTSILESYGKGKKRFLAEVSFILAGIGMMVYSIQPTAGGNMVSNPYFYWSFTNVDAVKLYFLQHPQPPGTISIGYFFYTTVEVLLPWLLIGAALFVIGVYCAVRGSRS